MQLHVKAQDADATSKSSHAPVCSGLHLSAN